MVQPTDLISSSPDTAAATDELVVALFAVVQRTRALSTTRDELDRATLTVLHQVSCDSPVRLSDVAFRVGLDQSTVSRHVRALVDGGLLGRTEDPQDGRACLLSATRAGEDVLRRAFERRRATLSVALSAWSTADRETLTELLSRLSADLADLPVRGAAGDASGTGSTGDPR
jgi:DNA-binding MarR family transcriptional regulator